jgi:ribosomal protein L29
MNIGCNYNRKKWKRNDVARVLTIMKLARVLTVMKAARVYAEARPPTTGISDAI